MKQLIALACALAFGFVAALALATPAAVAQYREYFDEDARWYGYSEWFDEALDEDFDDNLEEPGYYGDRFYNEYDGYAYDDDFYQDYYDDKYDVYKFESAVQDELGEGDAPPPGFDDHWGYDDDYESFDEDYAPYDSFFHNDWYYERRFR